MSNAKIIAIVGAARLETERSIGEASRTTRDEAKADIAALINATQDELAAFEFQLDAVLNRVHKLEKEVG